ncbi:MAG: Rieske (2Fe-2S) protein [Novosphingobium sp.]
MEKVGTIADLKASNPLKAKVAGKAILIFQVGDEVVATQARCPHAHGPLHEAEICDSVLTCVWHGWSFDLLTGDCEEDPDLKLERYAVTVEGDDIFVSV